jgi:aldose 1-epimerase
MTPFGTTADGRTVHALRLSAGDVTATILTLGAALQDLRLAGAHYPLTLGSDRVADYQGQMRHHGTLIGPVVNRLSGAQAPINGQVHRFQANQDNRHTLHCGAAGTHLHLWDVADHGPTHATLTIALPDGMGGFPGNRRLTARFQVTAPATLRMTVTATTDAATLINVANHSYWNLDGSEVWDGHTLQVHADRYLPTTPDFTPTGEIRAVAGTPMDFRTPRAITPGNPPFDTNYCLADARGPLRDALTLTGRSGVSMTVATTEPGIQIYDGRNAIRPGRTPHEGLAIEAQFWPDAPNQAGFPPIDLHPGQPWEQVTEWRFGRR